MQSFTNQTFDELEIGQSKTVTRWGLWAFPPTTCCRLMYWLMRRVRGSGRFGAFPFEGSCSVGRADRYAVAKSQPSNLAQ